MRANTQLDKYKYKSGNRRNRRQLLLATYPKLRNFGVQIGTEEAEWERFGNLLINRAQLIDTLLWLEAVDLDRLEIVLETQLHLVFKHPIFNCKPQKEPLFSQQEKLFVKLLAKPTIKLLAPPNDHTVAAELDLKYLPNTTQEDAARALILLILGEYQNRSNCREVESGISQASLKTTIANKTADLELILGGPIDSLELICN
jgi:hypothetical protein